MSTTRSSLRKAPFSAYVALVRWLMVELGFGRFFELFEERFGKPLGPHTTPSQKRGRGSEKFDLRRMASRMGR